MAEVKKIEGFMLEFMSLPEKQQIELLNEIVGYTSEKYGVPDVEEPIQEAVAEL